MATINELGQGYRFDILQHNGCNLGDLHVVIRGMLHDNKALVVICQNYIAILFKEYKTPASGVMKHLKLPPNTVRLSVFAQPVDIPPGAHC